MALTEFRFGLVAIHVQGFMKVIHPVCSIFLGPLMRYGTVAVPFKGGLLIKGNIYSYVYSLRGVLLLHVNCCLFIHL